MHRQSLLGVGLDQFEILGERGGRAGLSGGLGGYEFGHLLPKLFGACDEGRRSRPDYQLWVRGDGRTLVMCCCMAAISICF